MPQTPVPLTRPHCCSVRHPCPAPQPTPLSHSSLLPPPPACHPLFALTDQKTMKCEYENALVLVVEKKISG
jgi:hypothetical protein